MTNKKYFYIPSGDDLGFFPLGAYQDLLRLGELLEHFHNNTCNEIMLEELSFLKEYFNAKYEDVQSSKVCSIQIVIRTYPNIK